MKIQLSEAIKKLELGEVVAVPTETVYGLAGLIDNQAALQKIFAIKERPFFDPLIVHVGSIQEAKKLTTHWDEVTQWLAETFWPGPLTLVLPKASHVSGLITADLDTVGIRMPRHPITLKLLEKVGPFAAPSANKFGKTSPTSYKHVEDEFKGKVPCLDAGACEVGIESTVLGVKKSSDTLYCLKILRPGKITKERIVQALTRYNLNHEHKITFLIDCAEDKSSPGHMEDHYQPKIPLFLVDKTIPEETLSQSVQSALHTEHPKGVELILDSTPEVSARNLYHQLRELGNTEADFIFVRKNPEYQKGFWPAIWNRLEKASSYQLMHS